MKSVAGKNYIDNDYVLSILPKLWLELLNGYGNKSKLLKN